MGGQPLILVARETANLAPRPGVASSERAAYATLMTQDPPKPPQDPARERRNRLVGRILLLGLVILLLLYIVPSYLR